MTRYETTFHFNGFSNVGYRVICPLPVERIQVTARRPFIAVHSVGHGVVGEEAGALEIAGRLTLSPGVDLVGEYRNGNKPFDVTVYAYDVGTGKDRKFHLRRCYLVSASDLVTEIGVEFVAGMLLPWEPAVDAPGQRVFQAAPPEINEEMIREEDEAWGRGVTPNLVGETRHLPPKIF